MALTSAQEDDLEVGTTLVVPAFTVTVLKKLAYDECIKVEDEQGFTHYIYRTALSKPVPYENDKVYRSAYGDLYRYIAAADRLSGGTWQPLDRNGVTESGVAQKFSYPSRPMQLVTFGPKLDD